MVSTPPPTPLSRGPRPMAVIEIGPTGIRLLIARSAATGDRLAVVADHAVPLLQPPAAEASSEAVTTWLARGTEVIEHFVEYARRHAADPILLAILGASRANPSGNALRGRIVNLRGVTTAILDQQREAELGLAGALPGLAFSGTILVGDLSDGGLVLTSICAGELAWTRHFPVWPGRLAAQLLLDDPPTHAAIALVEQRARAQFADLAATTPPPDRFIVAGELARDALRLAPRPDGNNTLSLRRLNAAVAHVTSRPSSALAEETGLSGERLRNLGAGIAIVGAVLAAFGIDRAEVGEGGVREGLILDFVRYQRRLAHR